MAIVDEGILSLTDFKTPDPYDHFFAPKRFDFDVFDNYGRILYGRYGGDLGPLEPTARPRREAVPASEFRPGKK